VGADVAGWDRAVTAAVVAAAVAAAAVDAPPSSVGCPGVRRRRRRRRLAEGVCAPPSASAATGASPSFVAFPSGSEEGAVEGVDSFWPERVPEDRRRREPDRFRLRPFVADPVAPAAAPSVEPPASSAAAESAGSAVSDGGDSCCGAALEPPRLRPRLPRRRRRERGRASVDPPSSGAAWGSRASSVMRWSFRLGERVAPFRPPARAARAERGTGPGSGRRHVTDPARRGRGPPGEGLRGGGPAGPDRGVVEQVHRIQDSRGSPAVPGTELFEPAHVDVQEEPHGHPVDDHRGPPVGDQG
jgi:hypothetical protein